MGICNSVKEAPRTNIASNKIKYEEKRKSENLNSINKVPTDESNEIVHNRKYRRNSRKNFTAQTSIRLKEKLSKFQKNIFSAENGNQSELEKQIAVPTEPHNGPDQNGDYKKSLFSPRGEPVPQKQFNKKRSIKLGSMNSESTINYDPNAKTNEKTKIKRRPKKSLTLVEKNKNGAFKEELQLKVTTDILVDKTEGLPTRKYKVLSKIGDGSFGTVYLAVNLVTQAKVALKKILKKGQELPNDDETKNEIEIVKKLDHPNIVKIIEFYSTNQFYYIINEYAPHGELYSQIKNRFNESQLCFIFYQIFSGLYYLHSNHIIHRDLKLENILITEIEKSETSKVKYFWIKIGDFGSAKIFSRNRVERTVVGSLYYIAPEVLKKQYNEKCDTWSAGVILYMFIVGKPPFDGVDDEEIISKIRRGRYHTKIDGFMNASTEVQDLIKKLLEVKVDKRLSAKEALAHPWFKKYNAKSVYLTLPKEKINVFIDRLFQYKVYTKFQQIVLAYIVHNVEENDEIHDIQKLFRIFNTNDDGRLTKEELYKGLCAYREESEVSSKIDDIFFVLNGSNTSHIYYEEFLCGCMDKSFLLNDDFLKNAFNFIDKDNFGAITLSKMKTFFGGNVSQEVLTRFFNEVSTKKDEINFEEFKAMMVEI